MEKVVLGLFVLVASVTFAQPIKLGVNLELSGRFAQIGNAALEGIRTAASQVPEVLGRPIELSICDNQTSVEQSVACANRFVDEGVLAVLGPISSSMSIPAAEIFQDAGTMMISTASTNPATTQIGEYIFRMSFTDDFQGKIAARYAFNDLGAKSAIIFRQQDDDYSFGLANFFDEEFQALGGSTQIVDYTAGTTDFTAQINDVIGVAADVIYYSGFCAEGAVLIPALKGAGFAQQMLGADASDDSQCPVGGGDAFNGFLFTAFAVPEQLEGETKTRAEEFRSFFDVVAPAGTDYNGFTLAAADSYNVMVEAITTAGSDDKAAVLEALSNLENYPGVSGTVTYKDTDGTPSNRTMGFFEYVVPADNEQGWDKLAKFGLSTAEPTE
jgi:branched-chain amino acid transport system substrate-binding protein